MSQLCDIQFYTIKVITISLFVFVCNYYNHYASACIKSERKPYAANYLLPETNWTFEDNITARVKPISHLYDISRPAYDVRCGMAFMPQPETDLTTIYRGNESAKEYEWLGFKVTPLKVDMDNLISYTVSNGSYSETFTYKPFNLNVLLKIIGSQDARRRITIFMAIIGDRSGYGKISWFCDGVIINRNWILSAAHCFVEKNADIVRLGEYNLENDEHSKTENAMDFSVQEMIYYPDYKYPSVYHDLALLHLSTSIPYYRPDMRPICLPWDEEINHKLRGEKIIITGWGSAVFNGPFSPILQEANITVLDTAICEKGYSTLSDYKDKFPNGIGPDMILCAGEMEGGIDACRGDSGGPAFYLSEGGLYTLAGIVSAGYGCGLKEFPGIYIPINRPEYLSWIKKMSFPEIK